MLPKLLVAIGLSVSLAAPIAGGAEMSTLPSTWAPMHGDRFVVDVGANMGYLVHEDGTFGSFPVVTGQQRTVYYIGRSYYAGTPIREWVVQQLDNKSDDHVTFGPTGRFFRLSYDGEDSPYGIHGHRDAATMLASKNRYRSMGCIIVSESILNIIEQTFLVNGNTLQVITLSHAPQNGVELASVAK